MNQHKLPLKKAWAIILCTTLIVSGGTALAALYYAHVQESQKADPAFALQFIDQKGGLPAHYIEELLGLSDDQRVNIHAFCAKKAKKRLLDAPVIQWAEVKKSMPDACRVAYRLYDPVALLSDWDNAALDSYGRMIPFYPFYDREGLPVIAIGEVEAPEWGRKLKGARIQLGLKILQSMPRQALVLLDVSRADLPGFGQREVVITLEEAILRLDPDHWEEGWEGFLKMQKVIKGHSNCIVDLRISRIALIAQKPSFPFN